jgi:hypothetical protein
MKTAFLSSDVGRSAFSRENSKTSDSPSYANALLIGMKNVHKFDVNGMIVAGVVRV